MMMLDGIGSRTLDAPERFAERPVRGSRGEGGRFSVEHATDVDATSGADYAQAHSERANQGRRRPQVRFNRRTTEAHGTEHGPEELHRSEHAEAGHMHFDLDSGGGGEEHGEGEGEGEGDRSELAEEARDQATAVDFEVLGTQLLRLGGPIRDVTLYLPSLGRVTARMAAGAISIVVSVPRALHAAVRRGEADLLKRMEHLGLRVSHFQVNIDEQDEPEGDPLDGVLAAHGLIDVMA